MMCRVLILARLGFEDRDHHAEENLKQSLAAKTEYVEKLARKGAKREIVEKLSSSGGLRRWRPRMYT